MAATLNGFWGAETGGLQECSATSGTVSASTTQIHSGAYSYSVSAAGYVEFDPFAVIRSQGEGVIVGFWFRMTAILATGNLLEWTDGTNTDFSINFTNTSHVLLLRDYNDVTRITGSTTISANTWYFVEAYVERNNSGAAEFWVDGVSQGTTTGQDFNAVTGTPAIRLLGPVTTYQDDIYCISGATAGTDRLGGCEVYSYRSTLNSSSPDVGNSLNSGTWLNTQEMPWDTSAEATYTTAAAKGVIKTDDAGGSAGTGGPNTDANITGTIKAIRLPMMMNRDGGGGTDHYMHLGRTTGSVHYTRNSQDLDPTTVSSYYDHILSDSPWMLRNYGHGGTTGELTADGVCIGDDGTKLYLMSGDVLEQYALSTAWDLSSRAVSTTATKNLETLINTEFGDTATIYGVDFSSDGTKFYGPCASQQYLYEFTCSTAWDVSTATVSTTRFNISAHDSLTSNICVQRYEANGTTAADDRLWIVGAAGEVNQYSMSTAKDITTISHDGASGFTAASNCAGIAFSGDGTRYYIWDISTHLIHEVEVATAFDVTSTNTEVYAAQFSDVSYGLFMHPDGEQMYCRATGSDDWVPGNFVPTTSHYCSIGFEKSAGGQNFECQSMLAQILHVPPAAAAGAIPPFNPAQRFVPHLVR